jgi:type I site-specific restriction endonuclease
VTLNEAQTRAQQIDPQLRAADWKLNDRTQVRLEVPVDGYDAELWNGVTDYCLYDASGNVLAVVEAKRCIRQPTRRNGGRQQTPHRPRASSV